MSIVYLLIVMLFCYYELLSVCICVWVGYVPRGENVISHLNENDKISVWKNKTKFN